MIQYPGAAFLHGPGHGPGFASKITSRGFKGPLESPDEAEDGMIANRKWADVEWLRMRRARFRARLVSRGTPYLPISA